MPKKKPSAKSANGLYCEARDKWADCVDIGLYDDPQMIRRVAAILEKARAQDPKHVPSLALLADLLAALTAYAESADLVRQLRELEPDVEEHRTREKMLAITDNLQKRREIMGRLAVKWQGTSDW